MQADITRLEQLVFFVIFCGLHTYVAVLLAVLEDPINFYPYETYQPVTVVIHPSEPFYT
jgi:hypothetical protein